MAELIDELLCGDDIDLIYGDDWYFEMAEIYLSHDATSKKNSHLIYMNTETLKEVA